MWSHYLLITKAFLNTFQEILQTQTQRSTFWQPQWQTFTYSVRECEQLQFFTDFTVVAFFSLFHQHEIFVQHFLFRERNTIDTCHLRTFFIATPVSTSHAQQLHSFNFSRIHQVRTATKVCKRTLCIESDCTIFEVRYQLTFERFTTFFKHFQGISFRDVLTNHRFFLSYKLCHFLFDGSKVRFFNDGASGRHNIIVEAIFNSRTNTKLNAWIQLLQSFSHQVSRCMPEGMFSLSIIPFVQFNATIFSDRTIDFDNFTIYARSQNIVGQTRRNRLSDLKSSATSGVLTYRTVRKCYFNHSFLSSET